MSDSPKDSQISLRLPAELKDRMETYAQLTGRNKSYVVKEAVAEYLARRAPQIDDLREAIAAADRGEFASDEEVDAVFDRLTAAPRPTRPRKAR